MKFIKKIKAELRDTKFSTRSISLGLVFGVILGASLDSILIGISLGIIIMVASDKEEKSKNK